MERETYHGDNSLSKESIYPIDKSTYLGAVGKPQTSAEIRLSNLRLLIDGAGGHAATAKILDMDSSQLSQIAGRNPTRDIGPVIARRVEAAFKRPVGWLDVPHSQLLLEQENAPYNVQDGPDLRAQVPLISWVQAGNWADVIDNLQAGDAERWIPVSSRMSPHAYALRVVGDSMVNPNGNPSFPPDTVIVVDPERTANPGQFVVVRQNHDTECTFKQLVKDAGRFYLKPLNPQYPTLEMRDDAVVCGVLVQAIMEF